MKRRSFITLLGGAAAWPVAVRAQQGERVRRIGVLLSTGEGDRQRQAQLAAFVQRLTELGWAGGRNARLDVRWTAGNVDAARKYGTELVALAPDVIVTDTSFNVAAMQQATRTVPIVFGGVIDPVGAGLVDSLARSGRQYHWVHRLRIRDRREMARIAQGSRTARHARGGAAGSHHCRRHRSVRRHPGDGAAGD